MQIGGMHWGPRGRPGYAVGGSKDISVRMKLINIVGVRFGFWMVRARDVNNKHGQVQWLCECECGIKKLVSSNSLRTGNSTSCGCNNAPDILSSKFGHLIVLMKDTSKYGRRYWICECVCGKIVRANTHQLVDGVMSSCGCIDC